MPESKVVWRPRAERDLDDIFSHIAIVQGMPKTGFDFIERVKNRCDQLADFPKSGRPRDEIRRGLRSITFEHLVILYRPSSTVVAIVRVFNGARDYPVLFKR